jgi:hypothetical protein
MSGAFEARTNITRLPMSTNAPPKPRQKCLAVHSRQRAVKPELHFSSYDDIIEQLEPYPRSAGRIMTTGLRTWAQVVINESW